MLLHALMYRYLDHAGAPGDGGIAKFDSRTFRPLYPTPTPPHLSLLCGLSANNSGHSIQTVNYNSTYY